MYPTARGCRPRKSGPDAASRRRRRFRVDGGDAGRRRGRAELSALDELIRCSAGDGRLVWLREVLADEGLMKILSAFKAERTVATLLAEPNSNTPAAKKALQSLSKAGPGSIPVLIDALGGADKFQVVGMIEALSEKANETNFKHFLEGLKHPNQRCVAGVARAMADSTKFNPNKLFKYLGMEGVSKSAILDILRAHAKRLNVREVLNAAYDLDPQEMGAMFKLVAALATEDLIPDMIGRMGGSDHIARAHLIGILSRFKRPEVKNTLQEQLKDTNKFIRKAAIQGLLKMDAEDIDIKLVCSLLHDPDFEVQGKAVDLVIHLHHPDTIKYLIEALKDESEFARRCAVEVLNEIADVSTVKHLLAVVSDDDWWVRTRASDALAKIGGAKVIDAVLILVQDENEDVRRSAIEILNQTKDERAVGQLIKATKDQDWWVRERAIDALGDIGSAEAVPALAEMLGGDAENIPVVLRALSKLGQADVADKLLPLLQRPEKEIRVEAINALAKLAEGGIADTIKQQIKAVDARGDSTMVKAISNALLRIESQFGDTAIGMEDKPDDGEAPAFTMLEENSQINQVAVTASSLLDITKLRPGDVIENRYKYMEQIGKGAFGTVILVEDQVVGEELILKFLNADVSTDEEMMSRFVHELRFSRMITHKNVIRIYDFLHLSGKYAISMEYFPSHTLAKEMAPRQPLPIKKALTWGRDIAVGMSVAHGVGVIHRDLKPANLLINDAGLLKIVDFGVAAAASSGDTALTKTGYVIGSPKYMAPEQILGKKVDLRADVYSLGVIMYEMLTGVPPYTKGDHMAVMYQHVQGKAKRCDDINRKLPSELGDVVQKAMSVDPTGRFDSMAKLVRAMHGK